MLVVTPDKVTVRRLRKLTADLAALGKRAEGLSRDRGALVQGLVDDGCTLRAIAAELGVSSTAVANMQRAATKERA